LLLIRRIRVKEVCGCEPWCPGPPMAYLVTSVSATSPTI
jgi:hypothetical protein